MFKQIVARILFKQNNEHLYNGIKLDQDMKRVFQSFEVVKGQEISHCYWKNKITHAKIIP